MSTPPTCRFALLIILGAFSLAAGCSSSDTAPAPVTPTGGRAGDGGTIDAEGGAGKAGTAGFAGTGGSAGTAGAGGDAGSAGTAGAGGKAGAAGAGGAAGSAGAAGTSGAGGSLPDGGPDSGKDGSPDANDGSAGGSDADASDAEASSDAVIEAGDSGPATVLRIAAANLSSGNLQSYDPGHGIRIFQGLKPDVVLIQEFNYGANTDTDLRAFVDEAFGPSFAYSREADGQIPNGVISRYPILQSGEWDDPNVSNRDFAWAKIDLPGSADLWAVSVHLLTASAAERNAEAQSLLGYLNAQVPTGELLVLGGDFNIEVRAEDCINTLSQRFITAAPWPADEDGNDNTNAGRKKPYDWVMGNGSLNAYAIPLVIGSKTFPSGLVFDSRVYTALSEVPPILKTDSDAPSMQHMAVLRAFAVP